MTEYPIYVPSRGRATLTNGTAHLFRHNGVPFHLVVESHEVDAYADMWGAENLLVLPDVGRGIAFARNWIKDHAAAAGAQRHWQWDDNIRGVKNWDDGQRDWVDPLWVIDLAEKWTDKWANVGAAGLMSTAFGHAIKEPFSVNQQVYCAMLIRNDPLRFRSPTGIAAEDTDYSLQVLASGDCTIIFRAFQIEKAATGSMSGGNDRTYSDDGRLKRARWLQSKWGPEIVKVTRRHGRVHQDLSHVWRRFTQPLEPV